MNTYMTCKYRDLSFLVNFLAKTTCATMLLHVSQITCTIDTEPHTLEGFSILNTGNTFIISISQK